MPFSVPIYHPQSFPHAPQVRSRCVSDEMHVIKPHYHFKSGNSNKLFSGFSLADIESSSVATRVTYFIIMSCFEASQEAIKEHM